MSHDRCPPLPAPLAERMRPRSLADFVGQEHLVGQGRLLHELISGGRLPSLVLWGPPGTGKTTLANILASSVQAGFVFFSAVLSGVKEIRQIVQQAEARRAQAGGTVLFVDEIHRFSKSQQDAFLPHVESGLLTLIGATTENPSFEVIAPLLSRCQVVLLKPLAPEHVKQILQRALGDTGQGLGSQALTMDEQALDLMAQFADGDCRRALNCLETAAALALKDGKGIISAGLITEVLQERTLRYDKGGEEHYNIISALHKSLRDSDPDGACYWLGRMLVSGEDPLCIARRLIRFASEDVGISDPRALEVALSCRQAYHLLGSPEGELALLSSRSLSCHRAQEQCLACHGKEGAAGDQAVWLAACAAASPQCVNQADAGDRLWQGLSICARSAGCLDRAGASAGAAGRQELLPACRPGL